MIGSFLRLLASTFTHLADTLDPSPEHDAPIPFVPVEEENDSEDRKTPVLFDPAVVTLVTVDADGAIVGAEQVTETMVDEDYEERVAESMPCAGSREVN